MTKKLLSVLLLLVGVVQGAMAQEKEAYAALSDDNSELTFYYDTRKDERSGMSVGPFEWDDNNDQPTTSWYPQCETITTVVFDASFADYQPTSTAYWFYGCYNLTTITGIKNLKTDNVTDMRGMFEDCSGLTSLDVSGFKTDKVTDMKSMFGGCYNLTSLDLSGFKTDNVTDMGWMFSDCESLTSLDLSGFNTANVTDMSVMFGLCEGLTSLDVSNFDTGNVTDMDNMFCFCSGLENIFCNDTWSCSNSDYMFEGCFQLPGYSGDDATYAKPIADGGYFTPINEVDGAYWWTYYTDEHDTKFDANTTVYTATLSADKKSVALNEVTDNVVPIGQAVILKTAIDKPLIYYSTEEVGEGTFPDNDLKGTTEEKATEGTVYTLAAENDGLGFYRYTFTGIHR